MVKGKLITTEEELTQATCRDFLGVRMDGGCEVSSIKEIFNPLKQGALNG